MQTLRVLGLVLLAWCQPYYEYVPTTGASLPAPTHATPITERDASGELPSTAESSSSASPGVMLPFFPFFPLPQIDLGRGYESPRSPAYGPGGGNQR